MFTTDITPHDFDDLARLFDRLDKHLSNLAPVFWDLGELLARTTKERFIAGKAPDGTPWAPKSPTTIEAYRRREGDAGSGFTRPLIGPSEELSKKIFYEVRADSVEIGSALVYAGVMQFGAAKGAFGSMANGSPIPWGNIPARPFLGLSPRDEELIGKTLTEHLDGAVKGGN